jgi:PQQ-like domain/Bacterial Ig-like domain (group 2)
MNSRFVAQSVMHVLAVVMCFTACGGGGGDPVVPPPVLPPAEVPVASLQLTGGPPEPFLVGDSALLVATPYSAAGAPLGNRTITWSSSAPTVVSVSAAGRVTALREGIAVITATSAGFSATARYNVGFGKTIPDSGGVIRNPDSTFVLTMGSRVFPRPTLVVVRPAPDSLGDARVVPGTLFSVANDSLTFFPSALLRLRFDPARIPAGLSLESLQLHVRAPQGWAPVFLTSLDQNARTVQASILRGGVYAVRSMPVSRIVITGLAAGGGLYAGGVGTLSTAVFDSLGIRQPDRRVSWRSSSPTVISVDSTGKLAAGAPGVATITASADGVSATTTVTSLANAPSDFTRAAEWTTFQGSMSHTGYVDATIDPTRLREIWSVRPEPGADWSQVTVGGGRLFLATQNLYVDQKVLALNALDGARLWTRTFPEGGTFNQPTFANGSLYVTRNGVNAAFLVALRDNDGGTRYQTPFDGFESTSQAPVIVGTTLATPGGLNGGLYGFDLATGAQRFFRVGTSIGLSAPSEFGGQLFTTDRGVQSINPLTGSTVTRFNDIRLAVTTLAVNQGGIGFGITDGRLFSVNLASGGLLSFSDGYAGTPVARQNAYAFTAEHVEQRSPTGALVARYALEPGCGFAYRSLILTSNLLLVSCDLDGDDSPPGITVAIDVATGLKVWSAPVGGTMSLSAAGLLYIVKGDRITAFRAF